MRTQIIQVINDVFLGGGLCVHMLNLLSKFVSVVKVSLHFISFLFKKLYIQ